MQDMFYQSRGSWRPGYGLILLLALLLSACERFPRDPERSLEQIQERGILHVGVQANPPWVTGTAPAVPRGVESQLVEDFARELGVSIDWYWGDDQMLFEGLMHYELDLLIGGFTEVNPWREHAAFTLPYYQGRTVLGLPLQHLPVDDMTNLKVAVRRGVGLRSRLEARGAVVEFHADLAGGELPVAAREWEVEALGMRDSGIVLQEDKHVLVVPRGENALLMRLERFLLEQAGPARIDGLIAQQVAPP